MDTLPFRPERRLARALGVQTASLEICTRTTGELPNLRCVLPQPVRETVSLVLRVHTSAGIPLASAAITMKPGDQVFETPALGLLAMEGYAHLGQDERRAIERRVWSRRSFVTGSTV